MNAADKKSMDRILLFLSGGLVHDYPTPAVQPEVRLTSWQVMKVWGRDGKPHRRLVGRYDYEGRMSSEIETFDVAKLRATTTSGRAYELAGPPGQDADALWVWRQYTSGRIYSDVTAAVMRLHRKLKELSDEPR